MSVFFVGSGGDSMRGLTSGGKKGVVPGGFSSWLGGKVPVRGWSRIASTLLTAARSRKDGGW